MKFKRLSTLRLIIVLALGSSQAIAQVDIALTAAGIPGRVVVDRTATIVVEVFNFGDETATNVIVAATLPTEETLIQATTTLGQCSGNPVLVCSLGDLPAGTLNARATISIEVTANQAGIINHSFSLATSASETELSNNIATATLEFVTLEDSVDLAVGYGQSSAWVFRNSSFTVPVHAINYGPQAATAPLFEFRGFGMLLADLESVAPSQGSCTTDLTNCVGIGCVAALQSSLAVRCQPGSIAANGQVSVMVTLQAPNEVGITLDLLASISDPGSADPDMANNSSSLQIETIETIDAGIPISGGPSACFIATAAYGSDMHEDVLRLRQFRERYLVNSEWGRNLIVFYYRHSPALAEFIRDQEIGRAHV